MKKRPALTGRFYLRNALCSARFNASHFIQCRSGENATIIQRAIL
jgi:hypothetical protein